MSREMKLRITLLFSLVSSLSIVMIPLMKNAQSVRAVGVPLIFWAGLISEQIMFLSFGKSVKKDGVKKGRIGAISFFKCKEGKIADIVFLVSAALLIIITAVQKSESLIQYILIFAAVLSFRCHAVFNGRVYEMYKSDV